MPTEQHRHHGRHSQRRGSEIAPFNNGAYDLGINPASYALLANDLVWVDVRPRVSRYEEIPPGSRVRYNGALVRTVKDVERHETLDAMLNPDNLPLFNAYGFMPDELKGAIERLIKTDRGVLLFIYERLEESTYKH